eukprot:m.61363 g.61363  ORF g.61363 m.61363 type:complete len:667 (+) comp49444_c0_seq1:48-2048(+)
MDQATQHMESAVLANDPAPAPAPAPAASSGYRTNDGVARIKPEFLVRKPEPVKEPVAAAAAPEATPATSEPATEPVKQTAPTKRRNEDAGEDIDDDGAECNTSSCNTGESKRSVRGQNKKRPRFKHAESNMCNEFMRSNACLFGASCKFSHDVEAYLAAKEPDADGICPFFEVEGACRFGITCRFAKSHLAENVKAGGRLTTESASLSRQTQTLLRKRTFPYPRTEQFEKENPATAEPQSSAAQVPASEASTAPVESEISVEVDAAVVDVVEPAGEAPAEVSSVPSEAVGSMDTSATPVGPIVVAEKGARKPIDFKNGLYLAPLTTVGNLPFRRVCKQFGVDITCGEMAMAVNLLQGTPSEWALTKRHESEDKFGVQICGSKSEVMLRCAELLSSQADVDFIDINCGCPIDMVYKSGAGSALLGRPTKLERLVKGMSSVIDIPLTVKIRTGISSSVNTAHNLIPRLRDAGASLITLHGRSREQRYSRLADWNYIDVCAAAAAPLPLYGNGDILSVEDAIEHRARTRVSGMMVGRGALIKPWLFKEIKDEQAWDISANERLDVLRDYCRFGLEHWGSDKDGVEKTRRFMLEWCSFLYRYIPLGLLEQQPQRINERPPQYVGRNDLETLMASNNCQHWVQLSEMLLGPIPSDFLFLPKHKANSYNTQG